MEKTCVTCFYNLGKKCKILHEKTPKNCSSWADEPEARRREEAIVKYSGLTGCDNVPAAKSLPKERIEKRTATRLENMKNRKGRTIKEILDENFNWYYLQGFNDVEIGKKLNIDSRRIADYRNRYNLPMINKKNRPAPTETAS